MGIDQKRKVGRCFDAYERFVMIGSIALGLLQLISLKYQNVKGEDVVIKLFGSAAFTMQQEIDHLNGKLIID